MANWEITHGWSFNLDDAVRSQFYQYSYWGADLLQCVLQWLSHFRWPSDDAALAPEHTGIGVSWMELMLSFMLFSGGYIPLHRRSPEPMPVFAWARSHAEPLAFNYPWNECASQFASIFSQTVTLCGFRVVPDHIKRARICSLYRQGAGTCVNGLSHRPMFPLQDKVASVIQKEFQQHLCPCSYNWWPAIGLVDCPAPCLFSWTAPSGTWNVLQKRLKQGTRAAKASRA